MDLRKVPPDKLDAVFLMGYDAWGEGRSVPDYLEVCRSSKKYAEGSWFMLVSGSGVPVSSLVVYDLNGCNAGTGLELRGIGSVATPLALRGSGYATELVSRTIEQPGTAVNFWFLYSDIDPAFYERLGFRALPPGAQNHLPSVLMVRPGCGDAGSFETVLRLNLPAYF